MRTGDVAHRLSATPLPLADRLPSVAITALFVLAAAAGGVVVASGNLVLIGLAVGALLGVLLLQAVGAAVWLVLVGTLLVTGPLVMHAPGLVRLRWLFSILGFFLLAAAVVHEGANRDPRRPGLPFFMKLALVFVVYAVGMLFAGDGPLEQGLGAIKRYFQYWGLAFALAAVTFRPSQVRRWLAFVLLLALVQLPFAVYQRLVLMPRRLNMPDSVVPVDIVAGTMEGSITGGANNNVMVYLLITVFAGLLALRREGAIRGPALWLLLPVVAAPLALGETKLAVVLLPIALLAIGGDLVRRRPLVFAAGALVTAAAVATLFYSYVQLQAAEGREGMTFEQRLEQNIEYNFGARGYFGGSSLNRGNVVPYWWSRHGARDPFGTLFGHGLGASHGPGGADSRGHMDRQHRGYSIGLTAIAVLLWDVGLVGAALFLATIVGAAVTAGRLAARASPGLDRALCRTLQASAAQLVPMVFAVDLLLLAPSLQVLAAFTLGLIAWRARLVGAVG